MSGSAEAVTALVFDGAPAAQGAAQFDAAGQKIIAVNREVVNATSRTVDAQGNMERALARLTRQIDPAAAAQAKLEAGQRLLERAFQRGAITAEEQARSLALLETRYRAANDAGRGASEASQLLTQRMQAATQAAERAAQAQDTLNRALGVRTANADDTARRAADIAAYGAELDRLRAKFDPLFAAQQRYRATLAEIAQAERLGALAATQAAAARAAEKDRFAAQVVAIRGLTPANDNAAASLARLNAANDNATASSGRFNGALGQVGFQVQDFATQVSMGQNALMAFGVQFAQLAGFFGATGAIAGAGVMIGVIAAQLLLGKTNADALNEAIEAQDALWRSATDRAEQYRAGLEAQRQTIQDLRVAYAQLTAVALASEERRLQAAQATLQAQREQLANDAQAGLRQLPRAASNIAGMIQARQRVGLPVENLPPQVTEAVGAILQFRAGDANAEALAQLSQRLTEAASVASTALSPALLEVRDRVDQLVTRARELDGAMGRNEQQLRAVRDAAAATAPGLETAETTARRTAGSFAELAGRAADARNAMARLGGYQLTGLEGAQQALERANAELRALQQGGLAGGEAFTREEQALRRIATAREEDVKNIMERSRVSREQAEALADDAAAADARSQVVRDAVAREAEVEERRRKLQEEARDAARGTTAAVLDLRDAYGELRRDAQTGLMLVSDADARAIREISQQLRGTALDPAIRQRADADAARAAEREAEQRQREADRFTQNWGDRLAQETTRGFFEGTRNGESFFSRIGTSLKNILISAISAALSRQVFQPLISAALGGGGGSGGFSLGNLFGGGTAQAATPAAGKATGGGGITSQLGGASSLYRSFSGVNPTNYINGTTPFNTGFSAVDGFLATPIFGGAANAGVNAGGAVTNAAGYGSMAANSIDAAGSAAAAGVGTNGLTIGGAASGALGIAGGAYGVYSGLQKGGLGGGFQVAGGALTAGLSAAALASMAVPVYGWIAAAILTVAGALLPGAKPSSMGQLARTNLNTGAQSTQGLGGDRYSAGNAAAAGGSVESIVNLAKQIGDKLGGARIGGDVAVGVTRGDIYLDINGQQTRAANSEQGSKDIAAAAAQMIINEFGAQGVLSKDYQGIVNASGGSLERLDENLRFYEEVWKTFETTATAGDKVAEATKAVVDRFNPLIAKAQELGLSSDKLVEAREREWQAAKKAVEEAERARVAEIASLKMSLDARMAATKGVTDYESLLVIGQTQRAAAWAEELRGLEERLRALGVETADAAVQVEKLRAVQGAEYWKQRNDTMEGLDYGNQTRILRANGLDGSADWMDFEQAAKQQIEDLRKALAAMGVEAWIAAQKVAETEQAINAERQARIKANHEQIVALGQSLNSRILRASGRGSEADLADFEAAAAREIEATRRSLVNLGATAATIFDVMLKTEQAIGAERVALQERIAEEIAAKQKQAAEEAARAWEQFLRAGQGIRQYIDQLRSTVAPGGPSAAVALTEAQKQFGADLTLARGADQDALARIAGTADRVLKAAEQQFASGTQFQAIRSMVISSLENLPATRSYDAMILDELKKLGGGIDVSVEIAVIRVITETLNALPGDQAAKLVQTQIVLRTVEENLGRALTSAERASLAQAGTVLLTVEQMIGRDLTATERASLISSGVALRSVEQAMGRNLTAEEREGIISGGTIARSIEQAMGRNLTDAERQSLITSGVSIRSVEQAMGRNLTSEERASLIASGGVLRLVEQAIGRNLSAAEREGLVVAGNVQRTVQQVLGRTLTPAELAMLVEPGFIQRTVRQQIETTETVQISRSIDDKLSGILNAQLVIAREQLNSDRAIGTEANNHTRQIMSDLNILWRTANGMGQGLMVYARPLAHSQAPDWVKFAKGGVFDSPVTFPMRDGRTGMLGEAGPEAIMPLRRGPDGALGVRATQPGNAELVAELRAIRREVAELRQERAAASERQTRVTAAVGQEAVRQGAETNALLRAQADQQRLAGAA